MGGGATLVELCLAQPADATIPRATNKAPAFRMSSFMFACSLRW